MHSGGFGTKITLTQEIKALILSSRTIFLAANTSTISGEITEKIIGFLLTFLKKRL